MRDHSKAMHYFTFACQGGVAQAQHKIGLAMKLGGDLLRDPNEAARLLKLSAEQGYHRGEVE
jgi:TPR repeat protein